MKITKISIRDFLGIAQFKAECGSGLNRIKGGNGVGKTSILKAIEEAFRERGHDPELIRVGADKAEIVLELDNNTSVTRIITEMGNRPKVVVDGQPVNAPLKYLSNLIGPFSFNPVEFFLSKPAERRRILLSSIPFTISREALEAALAEHKVAVPISLAPFSYSGHGLEVLETIQKAVFETRAEVNRERTQLAKSIEQDKADIPETFDAEKYRDFDVTKVTDQLQAAQVLVAEHRNDEVALAHLRDKNRDLLDAEARLEAEIEVLTKQILDRRARIETIAKDRAGVVAAGTALKAKIDAFVEPDVTALRETLANYKHAEEISHQLKAIDRKSRELAQVTDKHEALEVLYKALTTTIPRTMLAQVKLPIANLEVKGDAIFVDGKSIEKLSTSEQLAFALNVARSLSGQLKVLCVDRFESLDSDAKTQFIRLAEKDGFEYFVTEVTGGELTMDAAEAAA